MYNVKIPTDIQLPSSMQLLKSTIAALLVAVILLISVILPAEYGVDPTGVGRVIGLTQMGEIKQQLAREVAEEERQVDMVSQPLNLSSVVSSETALEDDHKASSSSVSSYSVLTETRSVILQPGDAAEIKITMNEGALVDYEWSVDTGHVNYDTHGDNPSVSYFGYNKGTATTSDSGELQAAFDGRHGWFWRNRSNETVTVTLDVTGNFNSIERVL